MSDTPPMVDARPLPGSRDRTPELITKREKRHREDEDDRDDRHGRSRRHDERDRGRAGEIDDDEYERERRRRREEETDEERAERRRRRREREREFYEREREVDYDHPRDREDRDRERERGRYERDEYDADRRGSRHDRGERDRSRGSHAPSHSSAPRGGGGTPGHRELTREEREAERERRDREMREERREMARRRDDRGGRSQDYSPRPVRDSPAHRRPPPDEEIDPVEKLLQEVDQEKRSIFISQIAAALTSSDLGLFFEDKLGRGSVRDARVVTDKGSRRSKGIGYVELASTQLLNRALALSGTIVMGIPIIIQMTESERNREGLDFNALVAKAKAEATERDKERERERDQRRPPPPPRFPPLSTGLALPPGLDPDAHAGASIPYHRLFVTGLAPSLSADDLGQVFEPFGAIEFIDLHLDFHGRSKGTAYVQFRDLSAAQMALDAMDHFELAGATIKVQPIPERNSREERIEEGARNGGPRMDNKARQQLMYKLARTEAPDDAAKPVRPGPPTKAPMRPSPYIVVGNMFNPEEETERNWDLDLAEDVKNECERKYGKVDRIKVDKMSAGEVYIEFSSLDGSDRALKGLNNRFFGGRQLTVTYISEALFKAHM